VQDPAFLRRQVLVREAPGAKTIPSGTVTSVMKAAWSHRDCAVGGFGVWVGATDGVREGVWVGVLVAVKVGVRVGVREGVIVYVLVGLGVNVGEGVAVGGSITSMLTHIVWSALEPGPNNFPVSLLSCQSPR